MPSTPVSPPSAPCTWSLWQPWRESAVWRENCILYRLRKDTLAHFISKQSHLFHSPQNQGYRLIIHPETTFKINKLINTRLMFWNTIWCLMRMCVLTSRNESPSLTAHSVVSAHQELSCPCTHCWETTPRQRWPTWKKPSKVLKFISFTTWDVERVTDKSAQDNSKLNYYVKRWQ